MINREVERCLKKHDRNINWLAKKLGISWTAVKDKLNKNTFTGNELLDLCILFEDFDIKNLIEDRKLELLDEVDMDSDIRIHISGDKIGTLLNTIDIQAFKSKEAEETFNKAIPELSFSTKKSFFIEKEIAKEMDALNLEYKIEKV